MEMEFCPQMFVFRYPCVHIYIYSKWYKRTNYGPIPLYARSSNFQMRSLSRICARRAQILILGVSFAWLVVRVSSTSFVYIPCCSFPPWLCCRLFYYSNSRPVRRRYHVFQVSSLEDEGSLVVYAVKAPSATSFMLQVPMPNENVIHRDSHFFRTKQLGELHLLKHPVLHIAVRRRTD